MIAVDFQLPTAHSKNICAFTCVPPSSLSCSDHTQFFASIVTNGTDTSKKVRRCISLWCDVDTHADTSKHNLLKFVVRCLTVLCSHHRPQRCRHCCHYVSECQNGFVHHVHSIVNLLRSSNSMVFNEHIKYNLDIYLIILSFELITCSQLI